MVLGEDRGGERKPFCYLHGVGHLSYPEMLNAKTQRGRQVTTGKGQPLVCTGSIIWWDSTVDSLLTQCKSGADSLESVCCHIQPGFSPALHCCPGREIKICQPSTPQELASLSGFPPEQFVYDPEHCPAQLPLPARLHGHHCAACGERDQLYDGQIQAQL